MRPTVTPIADSLLSRYLRWKFSRQMQLRSFRGSLPYPHPLRDYLLYIHVPFCESLCPFCSFHRIKLDRSMAKRYFSALYREIRLYHDLGFNFSDVYVGGGTPTVLPEQLAATLDLVRKLFQIKQVSVETNPNHLQPAILDMLEKSGVNRLSVGVQSLDDELLREMERYRSYGSSRQILQGLARTQGRFDTFNVDMMFNFPHQSLDSLKRDVGLLKALGIDQISYYPLMPASTTQRAMAKRIGLVEFSRERTMYRLIQELLLPEYQAGSAWCFSRHPGGIIDEYIIDHGEYVGVGSGSFSYLDGTIYANSFSINQYLRLIDKGATGITGSRRLSLREQAQYDFLIRLFGLTLRKTDMRHRYGRAFPRLIRRERLLFKLLGALNETTDSFRLKREGYYYWVLMMREFFIGVNNFRAQMRSRAAREQPVCVTSPVKLLGREQPQ